MSTHPHDRVLALVSDHAPSLLRMARKHSLCADDAEDAYQRALEIFLRRADSVEAATAGAWLRTVVKHEAMAIRKARQASLSAEEVDPDAHPAADVPTPDERLLGFDRVTRAAEALQRLKAHELNALMLKAEGHSYDEIARITGWSYTKVNRCITEGRRRFLERYAEIETGEECRRWAGALSAIVDGEASERQVLEVRPHLRHCAACRLTVRELRDSRTAIAAVLPVGLAGAPAPDAAPGLLERIHEAIAAAFQHKLAASATKAQSAVDAVASGKVAAVAASAAAVAGGGAVAAEQRVDAVRDRPSRTAAAPPPETLASTPAGRVAVPRPATAAPTGTPASPSVSPPPRTRARRARSSPTRQRPAGSSEASPEGSSSGEFFGSAPVTGAAGGGGEAAAPAASAQTTAARTGGSTAAGSGSGGTARTPPRAKPSPSPAPEGETEFFAP